MEEGIENRWQKHAHLAAGLRAGLEALEDRRSEHRPAG
jgi:aspartate aminotransferase-like enzyme